MLKTLVYSLNMSPIILKAKTCGVFIVHKNNIRPLIFYYGL